MKRLFQRLRTTNMASSCVQVKPVSYIHSKTGENFRCIHLWHEIIQRLSECHFVSHCRLIGYKITYALAICQCHKLQWTIYAHLFFFQEICNYFQLLIICRYSILLLTLLPYQKHNWFFYKNNMPTQFLIKSSYSVSYVYCKAKYKFRL